MASTFGTLNTAYSGLAAARAAIDVTGQNIANVGTDGYTRQRVSLASVPGTQTPALFSKGALIGAGVTVTGIARLNDTVIDNRVRTTASTSGYWDTASAAISTVETSLNEPGAGGLSSTLNDFWAQWQNMGNSAGSSTAAGQASVLIGQGQLVASRIAAGYAAAKTAWSDQRAATSDAVTTINSTAQHIAALNKSILQTTTSGGNANELMDQRDTAITSLAHLTGATTRQNADGTIDVYLGGSTLVAENTARSVTIAGSGDLDGAGGHPVHLEWADSQSPVTIDGGTVAAQLATLAGPSGGTGGVYAETANVYNTLATTLATMVNSALAGDASTPGGMTPGKTPGAQAPFFALGTGPAATSLSVVPRDLSGIAMNSTAGSDGRVADTVSQLGGASGSPDRTWATFVSNIGVQSQNAAAQSGIATSAATSALSARTSQSGVDLDEETTNLVTFQHAYQAAARVITTIDSMLDTLINHTGLA
jgi:flagellar hook-associated protein 1 FlgK